MSFAQECKTEIANVVISDKNQIKVELEALLRLSAEVILRDLKFIVQFESANAMTSRRVLSFIKTLYQSETELNTRQVKKLNQGIHYQVVVLTHNDEIIKDFNLLADNLNKDNINASDDFKKSYLRGAFLARGSINDPLKGDYHLEIATTSQEESLFIQHLMVSFELNAKIVKRRNDFVIYLKDVSEISDFLRIIGASNKVFELDELVIKREYKTNIQRQMNAEIANQIKTLSAAKKQIYYIHTIEYNYPLEKLDPGILMVMKLRLENKEASLTELIEIMEKDYKIHITKSGINHRFMRIKEIAEQILNGNKEN
jgi:DNA-binding protein WhiA